MCKYAHIRSRVIVEVDEHSVCMREVADSAECEDGTEYESDSER